MLSIAPEGSGFPSQTISFLTSSVRPIPVKTVGNTYTALFPIPSDLDLAGAQLTMTAQLGEKTPKELIDLMAKEGTENLRFPVSRTLAHVTLQAEPELAGGSITAQGQAGALRQVRILSGRDRQVLVIAFLAWPLAETAETSTAPPPLGDVNRLEACVTPFEGWPLPGQ